MRRISVHILILLVSLFTLVSTAYATPTVVLDGSVLSFDVPPIIENGRTLVPLRAIFNALGAEVVYDDTIKTIIATKAETTIKLTIGSANAYKNNNPITLSVPAKIMNSRTLVPLRFVSESLGAEVNYDGITETITILSNNTISKPRELSQSQDQSSQGASAVDGKNEGSASVNEEIPSVKDVKIYSGLVPGKKMVIVELATENPGKFRVTIGETELKYYETTKKFAAEVEATLADTVALNYSKVSIMEVK